MRRLVRAGSATAVLLAAHAAWNARRLRRPPERGYVVEPVSLLVPARDEAHRIGPSVEALVSQQGLAAAEVLVLDDASTDGTAEVVRAVAGDRARVLRGAGPPPGWLGKPHACQQLADVARGRVLVFVDADVVLAPDAVARAVTLLRRHALGYVSPYPRQLTGSAAERLVQPLLQWSWLTFLPLGVAERSPRPSLAAAGGQFLVVDAAAYRRAGGHAAVRDQVVDDMALARALRRAGARGGFVDGTDLATCRMYGGARELADGYTKSLWAAFGSPPGALAAVTALAAVYVLPPLAALRGSPAGAVGYAAAVAGRAVSARATGGRAWPDSFAHPLSVLALAALTVRSIVARASGRLAWKGRPVR